MKNVYIFRRIDDWYGEKILGVFQTREKAKQALIEVIQESGLLKKESDYDQYIYNDILKSLDCYLKGVHYIIEEYEVF